MVLEFNGKIFCASLQRLSVNGLMNGDYCISSISMQMYGQPIPISLQFCYNLKLP